MFSYNECVPFNDFISSSIISLINLFSRRYVGVCCGIKVVSCLIFLLDYWLIRKRQNAEKKQAHLTMGEVVNSIISLDKRKLHLVADEIYFLELSDVYNAMNELIVYYLTI